MHLIGNLNHFIGATLGNSGYIREREKEFSVKDIQRHELIRNIDETILIVQQTLLKLTDADLEKAFPVQVMQVDNTTGYMLTHLVAHLSYHLGQINYHRRLTANN